MNAQGTHKTPHGREGTPLRGLALRRFTRERLAKELYETTGPLVRGEKGHNHLARATALAAEFVAYFDQREVIAEMRA
jgi:hypothetical protein